VLLYLWPVELGHFRVCVISLIDGATPSISCFFSQGAEIAREIILVLQDGNYSLLDALQDPSSTPRGTVRHASF
jgi:hypothetical protein